MRFHYIAVEGPIGVGKTTVVERLAERLDATTVLEEWAQNPFLKAFYDGTPGAAFQAELFFLLSRYRQQQELLQRKLFTQATLSRLRLREEQALRLPEPRRQRAADLREALRAARGERAAARPRGLPAGAHRGADEADPRARPARGEPALARSTSPR